MREVSFVWGMRIRKAKPVHQKATCTTGEFAFRVRRYFKKPADWMVVRTCECGHHEVVTESIVHCGRYVNCKACGVHRVHGMESHELYPTWRGMMSRCYDSRCPAFENYGGRGIRVDERWHDVRIFIADMGERPRGASIDRIDNDGPYSPENCRWASSNQQQRNTRRNRVIEVDGYRATVAEMAEKYGIGYDTILERLNRGWDAKRAVTVDPRLYHKGMM